MTSTRTTDDAKPSWPLRILGEMRWPGSPFGPGVPFIPSATRVFTPHLVAHGSSDEALAEVEIPAVDEKEATLAEYGWRVLFVQELDGSVTGHLQHYESGETLKTAMATDFEDA